MRRKVLFASALFCLILLSGLCTLSSAGAATNKVFTEGRYGEYCTDPAKWVQAGYKVGIWPATVPFKAQAVDYEGKKIGGTFSYKVSATKENGIMDLTDPRNLVYQKSPNVPKGMNYSYSASTQRISAANTIYRAPAKCDSCHAKPPGHIANQNNWGKCKTCHDLGVKIHTHAIKRAGISDNGCYTCHPAGCLDQDVHRTNAGMFCTNCHGNLSSVIAGRFKISGQAGKPECADCHDANHREPVQGILFADSNGHGGMLCISCHNSPHRIIKPVNFGDGTYNNCSKCHVNQANDREMGRNCGKCHSSSRDPHVVTGEDEAEGRDD
jgi:hypothetical protein